MLSRIKIEETYSGIHIMNNMINGGLSKNQILKFESKTWFKSTLEYIGVDSIMQNLNKNFAIYIPL